MVLKIKLKVNDMKRFLFTTVVCLLATFAFGQKKTLKEAVNELKSQSPNLAEARTLIKSALENPETANLAETWYTAGSIENKQFENEQNKEIMNLGKPNEAVMYPALEAILPYFKKAIELDRLPNEKGQVKPKYIKTIKDILRGNRPYYYNAGLWHYNKHEFQQAYEDFKAYGDIYYMDIFDDKEREKWIVVDSTENMIRFYAGIMAQAAKNHQGAIEIFESMKDKGYDEEEVYRSLAGEYDALKDTANFEKIIAEGLEKFPNTKDNFFLLHMININANKGDNAAAIANLNEAIAKDPNNSQFYDVLGQVYENDRDWEKSISNLKKAVELDPDNIDYNLHIGRVLFNLGITTRGEADNTKDETAAKELSNKSKDYYKEALPHFRKVFEQDGDNKQAVYALYSIYYSLDMGPEFEAMEPVYNRLYPKSE
jgi:tetratricopeptide (TPR) repeat protein